MTREEAIKIIEVVFKDKETYKYYDSVTHQALNMAIEALSNDAVSREHHDMEIKELKHQIKDQAEMVAVVRCKDCRYRKKIGTSYYCELDEFNVKDEDFCSWGERKGGDDE